MILQPQEIEVWYLIPAVRRELAKALLKKGLNQKSTAKLLGTTEACISHYVKSKRAKEIRFSALLAEEINKSADRLSKGSCVIKEVQNICRESKKSKFLCLLHKKYSNTSCGGCCCL